MTPIGRSLELQALLMERLAAILAGQGMDPVGGDVPVLDHVPHSPPRQHVRLDEFQYRPVSDARRKRWRHRFAVHVFDVKAKGRARAARLHEAIYAALAEWQPHGEATALDVLEGYSAGGGDAHSQHEIIRFETIIGE
ncbi:tail completion protein gp17 [Mangrovicoccus ximenensis]|uniref:tail completion protein gp17 n=1 Tax=Mangrovicoccus ximenensis TaxID=1911570 RepID=UPI000D380BC5|nr:DUF3168 domain-containing protein [Mangrovicoccus ximenensis]